ncbi:phospholipase [Phyllobacterium salinisoli]|uniref:Phospholipase D n=1 Tax=Phyllobacterium salinisoli TaxID=1899321 RepID=A0A368K6U4_9HYPH|nr:phospholipase D-like domain-containing protein [Phyllobacterium salinisoli]RCS25097.1 phospholipase [Phyllobacterium salinisoli]
MNDLRNTPRSVYSDAREADTEIFDKARKQAPAPAGTMNMARPPASEPIIREGRNAWAVRSAEKVAFLVDSEIYFRHVEQALSHATRSIWIVGWDFDPDIRLRPHMDPQGETLGGLLRRLVDANEKLEIRILVWSMGPIYSGKSLKLYIEHEWADHPRIHLRFDSRHALRGSHHQKMVCIDDMIAFVGGIDLTLGRWDTSDHPARSRHRVTHRGDEYGPVHDVQAMVSGAAARAIGDLTRGRWKRATGETIGSAEGAAPIWPDGLAYEISACDVAIARTEPPLAGQRGRRETIQLTADAIAAARKSIYIETQYLASFVVGKTVAKRLEEPDGPEVVILTTYSSRGYLEQVVMGHNRNRLIRRLKRADRFGRLRVVYAVVPQADGGECEVLIHSKVLIVDDHFIRIGSSNLNNRSEGLDTECDIAIEAKTDAHRQIIISFRNRLAAEHLDVTPQAFEAAFARTGSLVATIDDLNSRPRGVRPFPISASNGKTTPLIGTGLLDPKKPFWPLQRISGYIGSLFSKIL